MIATIVYIAASLAIGVVLSECSRRPLRCRLLAWWRARGREWRAKQRAIDVDVLWPVLWAKCGGDVVPFIEATGWHCVHSRAWSTDETEWRNTLQCPGRWAAARVNEAARAER